MNRYAYSPREVRQLRRRLWLERWRTLSWFDVKRARLWQGVICAGVVLAGFVIPGLIILAAVSGV